MRVDLFDFEMPEHLIALRPARPRDAARLLVVRPGGEPILDDRQVRDLPELLRPGDALVLNDTRVVPARLTGIRMRGETAARIEVTLTRREAPDRWRALARPAKRLEIADRIRFGEDSESTACLLAALDAEVMKKGEGGDVELRFALAGAALDEAVARFGRMPLPPYIASRRESDERDDADYQTIYSQHEGAVAAPTAGLHFTEELFARLDERGVSRHHVTMHVGPGTFQPVKTEDTSGHSMHAEWGSISADTADALDQVRNRGGRVIAVGSTAVRLLETAAQQDGKLRGWSGETALFIVPGHRFRVVDGLMTNFHLPRSTLFMLVCAFAGRATMQAAYRHAIASAYRFYSYGDASLILPASQPAE